MWRYWCWSQCPPYFTFSPSSSPIQANFVIAKRETHSIIDYILTINEFTLYFRHYRGHRFSPHIIPDLLKKVIRLWAIKVHVQCTINAYHIFGNSEMVRILSAKINGFFRRRPELKAQKLGTDRLLAAQNLDGKFRSTFFHDSFGQHFQSTPTDAFVNII